MYRAFAIWRGPSHSTQPTLSGGTSAHGLVGNRVRPYYRSGSSSHRTRKASSFSNNWGVCHSPVPASTGTLVAPGPPESAVGHR